MRKFLNSKVATIGVAGALLVGVPSVAYAHGKIGSPDIRNQSIQSWDIAKDGVGFSEIRKGSVGWYNELNGYTRDKIEQIAHDEAVEHAGDGEQGPKGDAGPAGKDGVSGHEPLNTESRWGNSTGNRSAVVSCPDGKVALGGGYEMSGTANGKPAEVDIINNAPVWSNGTVTGWKVSGNHNGQEVNVKVWVTCALAN